MDYETKALFRNDIRRLAPIFREIFGVKKEGPFPVLQALEKVPLVFEDCDYEIVENDILPITTPARCKPNDKGGFTIEIRNEIYKGAYEKRIGAYLDHICHEMSHIFLFKIGYVPLYNRSLEDKKIESFKSVEWQAKALTGEVMIPYEESDGMSWEEIMDKFHVSKSAARYRVMLDNGYILCSDGSVKRNYFI